MTDSRNINVTVGKQGFQKVERKLSTKPLVAKQGDLTIDEAMDVLSVGGIIAAASYDRDEEQTNYDYYETVEEFEEDREWIYKQDYVNLSIGQKSANGEFFS